VGKTKVFGNIWCLENHNIKYKKYEPRMPENAIIKFMLTYLPKQMKIICTAKIYKPANCCVVLLFRPDFTHFWPAAGVYIHYYTLLYNIMPAHI